MMALALVLAILALSAAIMPILTSLIFALVLIGWIGNKLGRRRFEEWQRQLLEARPPLSDEALAASLGLDPREAACWCAIRRAVAEECGGRPPETIEPGDGLSELGGLTLPEETMPTGIIIPDPMAIIFRLELHLGVRITPKVLMRIRARRQRLTRARYPSAEEHGLEERFVDFAEAVASVVLGTRPRERMAAVAPPESGSPSH